MAKPQSGAPQTPARMGLLLYARPLWASDATNLLDVHHLASARFLRPWFVRLRHSFGPSPIWQHLDSGQVGSGPICPPLGDSDATNLPDVHHLASARFLCPWFVRMRPSFGPAPIWRPPQTPARMGLGL